MLEVVWAAKAMGGNGRAIQATAGALSDPAISEIGDIDRLRLNKDGER